MKALYFAKPLEFRLETPAEGLTQGDSFSGEFHATHRGEEDLGALSFAVALAYAEFRAVKERPGRAFTIQDRRELGAGIVLKPGESFRGEWDFTLPMDCPITSRSGALFLLYGSGFDEPGQYGMLDLNVALAPVLETFIATVENMFSFQAAGRKHSKGFTEVKFKSPASYPTLEALSVLMRYREEEGVELQYQLKVKGFDKEKRSGVKVKPIVLERTIPTDQAFLSGRLPNRNLFKQSFEETMGEVIPSFLKRG